MGGNNTNNIPSIQWSDEYNVKVSEFNDQHMQLITLFNSLSSAVNNGKKKEETGKLIKEFFSKSIFHFATEEKILRKEQYPYYLQHKAEHEKLTLQLADKTEKFESAGVIEKDFLKFLGDWLVNHIIGNDKKYSDYLNNKGIY